MKAKKTANKKQYSHDQYEATRKGSFEKRILNSIYNCRKRAKKKKLNFTIEVKDFTPRSTCPCCGVQFGYFNKRKDNTTSPSIDRLDPAKGYIKENCWVICARCNTIKNDGTVDELQNIANAVRLEIEARDAERG